MLLGALNAAFSHLHHTRGAGHFRVVSTERARDGADWQTLDGEVEVRGAWPMPDVSIVK